MQDGYQWLQRTGHHSGEETETVKLRQSHTNNTVKKQSDAASSPERFIHRHVCNYLLFFLISISEHTEKYITDSMLTWSLYVYFFIYSVFMLLSVASFSLRDRKEKNQNVVLF